MRARITAMGEGPARRLTPEQAAEICGRYLAGESQRELAAASDCSQGPIKNTLRCGGVKARSNSEACMLREGKKVRSCAPRRLTPAQAVEVGRRYVRGETESSLAAAFDCHRREIGRALAILKIEKRSFAEVCALRGQKQRKPQAPHSPNSVQRSAGSAPIGPDPSFAALDAIILAERGRIGLGR